MRRILRFIVEHIYRGLMSFYPSSFRATFGEEIEELFLRISDEAEEAGNSELFTLYFHELKSLTASIIRERWHEWKSERQKKIASGNGNEGQLLDNGAALVAIFKSPDRGWIFRWTALMTAAILSGWLLMAPVSALLLWIAKLGKNVGIFPAIDGDTLQLVGFFVGLGLAYATAQWIMLRDCLSRMKSLFLATAGGFLVAGLLIMIAVPILDHLNIDPGWIPALYFLLIGVAVGVAQWIALRGVLKNAIWILVIDVLAAGSFLLTGASFTSFTQLFIIMLLPGLVTGIGLWTLLKRSQTAMSVKVQTVAPTAIMRRPKKWGWLLLGTVGIFPLYFILIWVYATSQIELAKSRGVYATAEEAVIARNSQGWGGAEVVKLVGVHAGPNRGDGSQPHVWFGGCTVYLDRVPSGWDRSHYLSGSFYLHVRDGWVHVPEGAFPEFVGWVMELYDLEGVNAWRVENQ